MKKSVSRFLTATLGVAMLGSLVGCNGNKGPLNTVQILVDGGGQNAQFNSTASMMYDKYANPYPYNTLEKLAKEWNKTHQGYEIKIASTSINNDRETMVPALNQGTAPEILFYLGTTIAEDMSKGWFVELNDYMEQPNKYSKEGEPGSEKWKDIYVAQEYATTFAPNGKKYTAELEMNPIGILYNKTLFAAAGITEEPKTFYDFMVAQDKVNAYAQTQNRADKSAADYICPYYPYYPWYDMSIESALYGEYLEYYDVLTKDGIVDAEEVARAYMTKDSNETRLYAPNDARALEKARLLKVMTKYYPANFEAYYAEQQFTTGNLVMMEALGGTIRKVVDAVDGDFEIGVFSYPLLTQRPESVAEPTDMFDLDSPGAYYTKYNVDKYIRRGLSGYTSGWAVTNSAINKGQETVDMCVDFLQYVTAYENNDKIINDKGFSIPLSGNTEYKYFSSLAADYVTDRDEPNAMAWGAVSPGGSMNKTYYDANYLCRIELIKAGDVSTIETKLKGLTSSLATAINNIYTQNQWDRTKWPAYDGPAIH